MRYATIHAVIAETTPLLARRVMISLAVAVSSRIVISMELGLVVGAFYKSTGEVPSSLS